LQLEERDKKTKSGTYDMQKLTTRLITGLLLLSTFSCKTITTEQYQDVRSRLIETHIGQDKALAALQDMTAKESEQGHEYWRWRVDQYLYEAYPDFKPHYDGFMKDKIFDERYSLKPLPKKAETEKKTIAKEVNLPTGYFTKNPLGNAYIGDSVEHNGIIYIAYQGPSTDPYICSYELKSGKWEGAYKVGFSDLSKNGKKVDHHGRPSIEVDTKGYIHVVFGGHGGDREDGLNPHSLDTPHAGGRFKHYISTSPESIKRFEPKAGVSPFSTYSQFLKMGNGDLYLFTRAGTHKSPWVYYQMKAGSSSFDSMVKITKPIARPDDSLDVDTYYLKAFRLSENQIGMTYINHICSFCEVHQKPHARRHNVYYMQMNTDDDTVYNIKGREILLPVNKAMSDKYTLAYLSKNNGDIVMSTRSELDENGKLVVSLDHVTDKRVWKTIQYNAGNWTEPGERSVLPQEAIEGVSQEQVVDFKKLSSQEAGLIYSNDKNETVFAIAEMNQSQWRLKEDCVSIRKAKMQLGVVKDAEGNNAALILNVTRNKNIVGGQALYLWADGKLRSNVGGVQ
jgi:hypothetical protein